MSFEKALTNLSGESRKRQMELDTREQALKRERKEFEKEKELFGAGNGNDNDVLGLNVGGACTTVLRRTLTQVEGSMLASKFSGRWDDSIEKDANGNFFIDQPMDLFAPLLDFLRRRASDHPDMAPVDPPTLQENFNNNKKREKDFLRMLKYYDMEHGVYMTHIEQTYGDTSTTNLQSPFFFPGVEVDSNTLSSFRLVPVAHERRIISFEIRVNRNVTDFNVGWAVRGYPREGGTVSNPPRIGTFTCSIGLDLARFEKHTAGATATLDRSVCDDEKEEFFVIRCDLIDFVCFVNGKEMFQDPMSYEDTSDTSTIFDPAISGTGSWQITKITYYSDCTGRMVEV